MRDHRKWLKCAPSRAADPSDGLCVESRHGSSETSAAGGQQNGYRFAFDMSMFEGGSFVSRCSVRLIHEVVCKFHTLKKDLVKSIGFEGILHFPSIKQFNRKFSLWLMSCVNERNSTINIGEHICMSFNKYDVAHVFGIPFAGKSVLDPIVASRDAKDRVIQRFLGKEFNDQRSIKIVQEILERDYGQSMNKEDADRFMVAFVVFVVSNLLSPSAKFDYAAVDYWNATQDPDSICNYDWCEFVITRLLEAVKKLKQDITNNIKFPNIAGCSVFLQVLYLDSLELEGLSMAHNSLPRVRVFSFEMIRSMIMADKNYAWHINPDGDIGIGEAAGPLFVAAAEFQERIDSGFSCSRLQAIKFMSVLVTLMIPYRRGFRYKSSHVMGGPNIGNELLQTVIINGTRLLSVPIRTKRRKQCNMVTRHGGDDRLEASSHAPCTDAELSGESSSAKVAVTLHKSRIGDDVQQLMNSAFSSYDDMPDYLDVNFRVARTMSKFYNLLRSVKTSNDFDLNMSAYGEICGSSSSTASDRVQSDNVPSPWELGFCWCIRDLDVQVIFDKLKRTQDDDSLAIVHREPKYIQVSFCSMCEQFSAKCDMELDLFDALLRTARQQDDLLFLSYGQLRWRHLFESDFMGSIISGAVDPVDPKIRDYLCLSHSVYDLRKCKLKNVISVFEPSHYLPIPESRAELIERACYMLKLALKTLTGSVFVGVSHDVSSADLCMLNLPDTDMARSNRSGVLCSVFYHCFDGNDLIANLGKVHLEDVATELLHEIGNLKENSGKFTSFYELQ